MKRLLSILIALHIGFGIFAIPLIGSALAVDISKIKCAGETKPDPDATKRPKPTDVIVLLTEPIANRELVNKGEAPVSCGQIIQCVRSQVRTQATDDNAKKTLDFDINTILIEHYSQCIVAGKDGLDLLNNYAGLVYRWIAGIVGAVCILVVIISGIQISMGGLSQEEVGGAKDRIVRSLVGMVVLFLSAFILYTINPIFFS